VLVGVPRIEQRYWSVALMDLFTNNFAMLGSRLDGAGPVQALLVGPAWHGQPQPGMRVIRAPSNDVWLLGRWLIDGPQDAPAVHAIQDALRVDVQRPADGGAPQCVPQRVEPSGSTDPAVFLSVVNEMLGRNPVPAAERVLVEGWRELGVRPGDPGAWAALAPRVREAWRAGIAPLHHGLRDGLARGARVVRGWAYPPPAIGNFGSDYGLRAAIALGALAALEPEQAIYLSTRADTAGGALDGAFRYRLSIPPGGLATDAFWSLSMYELMPDGRLFFVDNPIRRYAVGDRSRGLVRNPDGSIDLWIQHEAPPLADAARTANWLPSPAGAFQLTLRAYAPRPALLEGSAPLPRIERLG
jgi:hypothetical protein